MFYSNFDTVGLQILAGIKFVVIWPDLGVEFGHVENLSNTFSLSYANQSYISQNDNSQEGKTSIKHTDLHIFTRNIQYNS